MEQSAHTNNVDWSSSYLPSVKPNIPGSAIDTAHTQYVSPKLNWRVGQFLSPSASSSVMQNQSGISMQRRNGTFKSHSYSKSETIYARPGLRSRQTYPRAGGNWDAMLLNDAVIDTGMTVGQSSDAIGSQIMGAYCLWENRRSSTTEQKYEKLCFHESYIAKTEGVIEEKEWEIASYAENKSPERRWESMAMRTMNRKRSNSVSSLCDEDDFYESKIKQKTVERGPLRPLVNSVANFRRRLSLKA
ncbi:hypothetical protein V1512DRAFT_267693 [Lipomyces arxii]|uniref:uncharacterized protein n=1 Tax=Lipomyces arxii TaxID=56418 RepID=UPI0034CF4891